MTSSSAPPPPNPTPLLTQAPTAPPPGKGHARISLLLSLLPAVVWGAAVLLHSALFPTMPDTGYYTGTGNTYNAIYFGSACLLFLVSLGSSITATITGTVACNRAKRLPWRPDWLDMAVVGRVFGIIGIVVSCVAGPCAFILAWANNYHGG